MRILALILIVLFTGCSASMEKTNMVSQVERQSETSDIDFESYALNEDAEVLTMACWCLSEREAILADRFNRTHDDYQIKVISYFDGDPDHYETALLQMRTKLLTGDRADLYSLNSMDVVAMEQIGLFMDIYPLMEADDSFQREDYFMNVWEQYEVQGSLYEFVPAFAIRGLVGPKSLLGDRSGWTYEEMESFIGEMEEQKKTATDPISLQYMIQGSCATYLDIENGTCTFETESFQKWMELTKGFAETKQSDNACLETVNLTSINNYLICKSYYQETPVYTGLPSADGSGPYAAAIHSFAISSSTKYPDVCWEFLRGLLDEEMLVHFSGISMRKDVLEKQLSTAMLDPSDPEFPYQSDSDDIQALTQEEVDAFISMVCSVDHVKLRYDGVTDIIEEEMKLWYAGKQTKEQTMEYLQNRVGIYLAEQK